MATTKRGPRTKVAKQDKMHKTMREFKNKSLYSGSGHKVVKRDQAIAIGLKQAGLSKYQRRNK